MCPSEVLYALGVTAIDHRMRRQNERCPIIQRSLYGVDTGAKRFSVDVAKVRSVSCPRNHIVGSAVSESGSNNLSSPWQCQRGDRQYMSPESAVDRNRPLDGMKFRKARFEQSAESAVRVASTFDERMRIGEISFNVGSIESPGRLDDRE